MYAIRADRIKCSAWFCPERKHSNLNFSLSLRVIFLCSFLKFKIIHFWANGGSTHRWPDLRVQRSLQLVRQGWRRYISSLDLLILFSKFCDRGEYLCSLSCFWWTLFIFRFVCDLRCYWNDFIFVLWLKILFEGY